MLQGQQQQLVHANGAPNGVSHMRQWLAARVPEPARPMLEYHMESYTVVTALFP
jgi:hypothetical protein